MKTLLVLAQHPELAQIIPGLLNPEQYRVVHRLNLDEAESLLGHRSIDVCILDAEMANVQGVWAVEKLRRRAPHCPVIVYTGSKAWEWEEEAYVQGVSYVLSKPVRGRLLNTLLERLLKPTPATTPIQARAPAIIRPAQVVLRRTRSAR